MVIGDLVLVPIFGIMGAAYAVVLSSVVGTALILRAYPETRVRELLPRRDDLLELLSRTRHVVRDSRSGPSENGRP